MKILHIVKGLLGGQDIISKKIFEKIPHKQKIFMFNSEGNSIYKKFDREILRTATFKQETIFVNLWGKLPELNSADIIHNHHAKAWILFSPLCFFGDKTIYSFHQSFGSGIKKGLFQKVAISFIVNYVTLFSKKLIFLTEGQKSHIREYCTFKRTFDKKSTIINNFIEKEKILKNKKKIRNENILFVGRYTKIKGIDDLTKLAQSLNNVNFSLIGDNNFKSNLPNLRNIGKVENHRIIRHYDKNSIFILPSYTEAFPMTVLEAMARGLVILVSDLPGMREIVKEGRNGYLFPPGDLEKMKEIILYLKNNPEEIERISKNNLKDIRKFTAEKQVPKYIKVYGEVLKENNKK